MGGANAAATVPAEDSASLLVCSLSSDDRPWLHGDAVVARSWRLSGNVLQLDACSDGAVPRKVGGLEAHSPERGRE